LNYHGVISKCNWRRKRCWLSKIQYLSDTSNRFLMSQYCNISNSNTSKFRSHEISNKGLQIPLQQLLINARFQRPTLPEPNRKITRSMPLNYPPICYRCGPKSFAGAGHWNTIGTCKMLSLLHTKTAIVYFTYTECECFKLVYRSLLLGILVGPL
jgi:hypothetical protein